MNNLAASPSPNPISPSPYPISPSPNPISPSPNPISPSPNPISSDEETDPSHISNTYSYSNSSDSVKSCSPTDTIEALKAEIILLRQVIDKLMAERDTQV